MSLFIYLKIEKVNFLKNMPKIVGLRTSSKYEILKKYLNAKYFWAINPQTNHSVAQ